MIHFQGRKSSFIAYVEFLKKYLYKNTFKTSFTKLYLTRNTNESIQQNHQYGNKGSKNTVTKDKSDKPDL